MALLIKDDDARALAPAGEVIDALELALRENARARGLAPYYPQVIRVSGVAPNDRGRHLLMAQIGSVTALNMSAIRLISMTTGSAPGEPRGPETAGYLHRDWGLMLLFSMETAELLAIIPQSTLAEVRLGATTALAVKYLARADASVAAIFGSSKYARADLEAVAQVRNLRQVRVFSPNPAHRREFATEMSELLDLEVVAVDGPRAAVDGADIVCCSTSSKTPVFEREWLVPGQFVSTTQGTRRPWPRPSQSLRRGREEVLDPSTMNIILGNTTSEVDLDLYVECDRLCVLSEEWMLNEDHREILDLIDTGRITWDHICDLGLVIAGKIEGRKSPEDTILYVSTGGMGLQIAAAGAVAYRNAREQGVGWEIPHEWFSSDMSALHAKGYYPSP